MYSRVNYTAVGIFVLVLTIGMVGFGLWLGKYGLEDNYATYRLKMRESVSGLAKDSSVQLHGVTIGRVSAIRIVPEDIETTEVLLEIQKEIPIKEDMVASTKMLGITGLLSIEIEGGSNNAKTLKATPNFIPTIQTKPSFLHSMTKRLEMVGERTQSLLSKENLAHITSTLAHLDEAVKRSLTLEEQLIALSKEGRESVRVAENKLVEVGNDFHRATEAFLLMQKDFHSITQKSLPTIDKIMETSRHINRLTLRVERTLKRGDYNIKQIFEPMLIDIRLTTDQLNRLLRGLNNQPVETLFKSRQRLKAPGEF